MRARKSASCCRRPRVVRRWLAATVAILLAPGPASALTLRELLDDKALTPKRFASHFAEFDYEFGADVLPADVFLTRRKGDCDDYAVLAGHVLRHHGQTPRLIHVRMVGRVAHAVCYVTEAKAYLDYNNRKFTFNLERARPFLRDIAEKVADSLERNWTVAYEFTYSYADGKKRTRYVVVKTDKPEMDADRQNPQPPRQP